MANLIKATIEYLNQKAAINRGKAELMRLRRDEIVERRAKILVASSLSRVIGMIIRDGFNHYLSSTQGTMEQQRAVKAVVAHIEDTLQYYIKDEKNEK